MAGSTGLEPATSGVTGRRSNQLNYDPAVVKDVRSRFPSARLSGWRAGRRAKREGWWAVQGSNL